MYYVIFKDDDGKWYVKDKDFYPWEEAKAYRDTIDPSRSPRIVKDVNNGE